MKKMILAVVPQTQANLVLEALARKGFTSTYMESRGGLMHQTKRTLFVAVNASEAKQVINIIKSNIAPTLKNGQTESDEAGYSTIDPNVGGTVIFSWDIDHIETF